MIIGEKGFRNARTRNSMKILILRETAPTQSFHSVGHVPKHGIVVLQQQPGRDMSPSVLGAGLEIWLSSRDFDPLIIVSEYYPPLWQYEKEKKE